MAPVALMKIKLAIFQEQQSKAIKLAPKVFRADQTWEKLHVNAQQLSNQEIGRCAVAASDSIALSLDHLRFS